MRIRSIRPEFWRSRDISCLPWDVRLLFIGLWNYVDDNGIGLDRLSLIAADLFPDDLETDSRELFARVSRGLSQLSEKGRITRYAVDGKEYLHITNWERHQKIDKPSKSRYPLPTSGNADTRETIAKPSRDSREGSPVGEGEKGRRGEVEKTVSSGDDTVVAEHLTELFEDSWTRWLRKDAKPKAKAKFVSLCRGKFRRRPEDLAKAIVEFGDAYAAAKPTRAEAAQFTPGLNAWLGREGWDEPLPVPAAQGRASEPKADPKTGYLVER